MSSPQPSSHRLGPGLPGYLIPFAPLAFAPQRQKRSSTSLSPPAFLLISTHFTAPPEVSKALFRLSRKISPRTGWPAYAPFKPSDSEQRLDGSSYRGCWHELSPCFLQG